jgi:hypothetical protein
MKSCPSRRSPFVSPNVLFDRTQHVPTGFLCLGCTSPWDTLQLRSREVELFCDRGNRMLSGYFWPPASTYRAARGSWETFNQTHCELCTMSHIVETVQETSEHHGDAFCNDKCFPNAALAPESRQRVLSTVEPRSIEKTEPYKSTQPEHSFRRLHCLVNAFSIHRCSRVHFC